MDDEATHDELKRLREDFKKLHAAFDQHQKDYRKGTAALVEAIEASAEKTRRAIMEPTYIVRDSRDRPIAARKGQLPAGLRSAEDGERDFGGDYAHLQGRPQ